MRSENGKSENWLRELELFLQASPQNPPAALTEKVANVVGGELNPPMGQVVTKMLAIHLVAAISVLAFCPQLGVGPLLSPGHGLMMIFMEFGPVACAASCGALFLGSSFLLSSLTLTRSELRVAYRHRWGEVSSLAALSLGALMLAGSHGAGFILLVAWGGGALTAGWLVLTLVSMIRFRLHPL